MEYKQRIYDKVRKPRRKARAQTPYNTQHRARPVDGSVANPIIRVRNLPLFGLRKRVRLMYYAKSAFTGGASVVAAYVFSANGAYDPDITGTGLQPVGFDQMMTFYNHYTVLGSRVRATFQNTGTVTTHVALSVSGSSSVTTDDAQLIANGELVYTVITPTGIAGSVATLRTSSNAGQFQGITDAMDDPNMRGDAASNPTEQLYYHLSIWNPVNATVPSALVSVEIEYDVIFHEPRKAALS